MTKRTNIYEGVPWADLAVRRGLWPADITGSARVAMKHEVVVIALSKKVTELLKKIEDLEAEAEHE